MRGKPGGEGVQPRRTGRSNGNIMFAAIVSVLTRKITRTRRLAEQI
jgi:hypothetical protein